MITTCTSISRSRMRASVARPSMPGSQTSSTTTSYVSCASAERQASPLPTASTSYPSSRSTPPSALRTPGSSSTIRMDGISARQLDREPRAARRVVGDLDAPAVLRHDPADDREPEPAAAQLGRVIRKEELLALRRRDPGAVVGHDNPHEVVGRVVPGLDVDRASPVHGLDGVVDEIDDDAADLLGVDRHLRQRLDRKRTRLNYSHLVL